MGFAESRRQPFSPIGPKAVKASDLLVPAPSPPLTALPAGELNVIDDDYIRERDEPDCIIVRQDWWSAGQIQMMRDVSCRALTPSGVRLDRKAIADQTVRPNGCWPTQNEQWRSNNWTRLS